MYKFLRIVSDKDYEDFLNENQVYKHIPKRLLYAFQKKIKSRIVCRYVSRDSGKEVGLGMGVFLNKDNICKSEYKSRVIETINDIKEQEEYLEIEFLLDDNLDLDLGDLEDIKDACNVKISRGKDIFADNVLSCLESICSYKGELLSEKEVFIVSDDTKITEKLVNQLAPSTKFISIYSKDDDFSVKLEEDIFNKTGLCLNVRKDASGNFEDFNFIINLCEDARINISNLKKNKIVLDLSYSKCLAGNNHRLKCKATIIEDLFFENDKSIYSENGKCELNEYLNTSNYKLLCNNKSGVKKVLENNKILSIEQLVDSSKFKKQNQTCFNKTMKHS